MSHPVDRRSDPRAPVRPAGYDGPTGGYDGPTGGYDAPTGGYDGPSDGYDQPHPYDRRSQYGPAIEVPELPGRRTPSA